MDYTDVYFTLDGIALAVLLVAMGLACYLTHRRYRHRSGSDDKPRKELRQRRT